MDRYQSGRAGGVDGEAGAVQIQHVGDPVRRHRQRGAGGAVGIGDGLGGIALQDAVVLVRDADEDAGVGSRQPPGHDVRMLQRLPGEFQENALLGIHLPRLARRDPEEVRVEAIDGIEKAAGPRVDATGAGGVRMEVPVDVPAIAGNLPHRVAAGFQQFPELLDVASARQSTGHANDGNRERRPGRLAIAGHAASFRNLSPR